MRGKGDRAVSSNDEVGGGRVNPEGTGGEVVSVDRQARYQLALSHVAGRRVLDAGCGGGWGSAELAKAGARHVVGVDLDQGAITDAKRQASSVEFMVGDLRKLPFDDGSFEVVVCTQALEHSTDRARTLDELARVTRSDGLLFVCSSNARLYQLGQRGEGNEEGPDVLLTEVQARFSHSRLLHQHNLMASLLMEAGSTGANLGAVKLSGVMPLPAGDGAWSVVLASDSLLPDTGPLAMLAPLDPLDNITTGVGEVTAARERDAWQWQSVNSDTEADMEDKLSRLAGALAGAEAERDSFAAMVLAVEQELAVARQEHLAVTEAWRNSIGWKVTARAKRISSRLPSRVRRLVRGR